jgi:hypothetical protein
MTLRQPRQRARVGHAAQPAVAWLARHPSRRLAPHAWRKRGAQLHDLHVGIRRQEGEGGDSAECVLLLAQMADHRHAQSARRGLMPDRRIRRLVDDARLAAQARLELPRRLVLQHDDAAGELQRAARFSGRRQVPVQVGAGEHDGERPAWLRGAVAQDRCMAALRVQCDQEVAALALPLRKHGHAVACAAQHRGPARGRMQVAGAGTGARRRHDRDLGHAAPL